MKGSFSFNKNSLPPEFCSKLFKLADSGKSFPISLDETFTFKARIEKLIMETRFTNEQLDIELSILFNTIGETPLYKWIKEHYPDILMEYSLLGSEDLEKEDL